MNLTGHFLVGLPTQGNSIFADSVIYITEHSGYTGAVGVIINKTMPSSSIPDNFRALKQASTILQSKDFIHFGGPVNTNKSFLLQKDSNNKLLELEDQFDAILIGDNPFIVFGYALWDAMQLEEELHNNYWLTMNTELEIMFNTKPQDRYMKAMNLMGIDKNNCLCIVTSNYAH